MDVAIIILLSILLVSGFDYKKRCLLFNGTCVNACPRLMFAYHTRCDRDTMSQKTCESPLIYPIGFTCGWSRCDCADEYVLDEDAQVCVHKENCPRIPLIRKRMRSGPRKPKTSQRVKIVKPDEDLIDVDK